MKMDSYGINFLLKCKNPAAWDSRVFYKEEDEMT
jgi:hypothetical protein